MENALRACCKGIKIGKILILGQGTDGRQVCGCQYIAFSYSSKLRICLVVYLIEFIYYHKHFRPKSI